MFYSKCMGNNFVSQYQFYSLSFLILIIMSGVKIIIFFLSLTDHWKVMRLSMLF